MSDLTQKEGSLWTLKLATHYNLTVVLPDLSNIVYINELPNSIVAQENKTVLALQSGQWEISYVLPLAAELTTIRLPQLQLRRPSQLQPNQLKLLQLPPRLLLGQHQQDFQVSTSRRFWARSQPSWACSSTARGDYPKWTQES